MTSSPRVIILATSKKTRGGVTSVVKAHKQGEQWEKYRCVWIETQIDKNVLMKFIYLLFSFLQFIIIIPFYDIVHIHTSAGNCAKLKTPYLFIAKLLRKKIIAHIHIGSQMELYKNDYFFNYVLKNSDIIIVLSNIFKEKIKNIYNLNNTVRVIYNPCIDVDTVNYEVRKKQILFAGILDHNKGFKDLLSAFALIATKHKDWKLIFAGNGEIDNGRALADNLGIKNQVEFMGWVNGKDKDTLFKESSVFCLPSYAEGFPMSALDAWAYGLPVVCTPVGGLPDIIINGENSLVFNSGDVNKLSIQLERIITDEKLRFDISQKSKELALTTFNQKHINNQIGLLYKSLINV